MSMVSGFDLSDRNLMARAETRGRSGRLLSLLLIGKWTGTPAS